MEKRATYYERKEQSNRELIECMVIALGFMAVICIGCALWQWVSPWAVTGWIAVNVAFVIWRIKAWRRYRRLIRRLN